MYYVRSIRQEGVSRKSQCCRRSAVTFTTSPPRRQHQERRRRRRPLAFLWAEWRWSKGGFSAYILNDVYRLWLSANLIIFPFWLLIFFSFSSSFFLSLSHQHPMLTVTVSLFFPISLTHTLSSLSLHQPIYLSFPLLPSPLS